MTEPDDSAADRETQWRQLALKADSMLSLLRHRGGIQFGTIGLPQAHEVDVVIGQLRRAYEKGDLSHD